jgi:hypothetical protein
MGSGFFGFGGSDTSVSAPQYHNTGAAGQQAFGNAVEARDSGVAVGARGKLQTGGYSQQGNNNKIAQGKTVNQLSNVNLQKGASVTFNQTDADLLKQAIDATTSLASGTSTSLAGYLDKVNAATTDTGDKVLSALSSLAESKQTEGASNANRIVLFVVVSIVVGVVAIFGFLRRK